MRRGTRAGIVAAVAIVMGALLTPVTSTAASWRDSEYVSGSSGESPAVGTVDCQDATGAFDTRAAGRVLSGSAFGVDLDSLAEASGVVVTNDGTGATVSPVGANPAPADPAYANPLDVTALASVNANLGGGLLQLPLDNSTGALGQYASADSTGQVAGASGFITSTGGIATAQGDGYPEFATLKLSDLLGSLNYNVGELLPNISDVGLETGAVTGRATLDGCAAAWGADLVDALTREYLVSSLDVVSTTPTVDTLATGVSGAVTILEDTVNGLASDQVFLDSLTGAVTGLVDTLVSGVLGLGDVSITKLTATIGTTAITEVLDKPFGDDRGVLTIDPTNGEVRIDTAALLQQAYPGQYKDGLNGLPPNTDPFADPDVVTALTGALSAALGDWLDEINDRLDAAIDAVAVSVAAQIKLNVDTGLLGVVPIGTVTATVDGSLGDLLAGTVPATVTTDLDLGLVGALLMPTVNTLVSVLTTGLVSGLGTTVGTTLNTVLDPLRTLPTTVTDSVTPIITAISGLYTTLFVNGIVNITVNAQNDPAGSPTPGPVPSDWNAGPTEIPHGQFDVAALRIGVLDSGGAGGTNDVHLYLGRGSVGPVRSVARSGE